MKVMVEMIVGWPDHTWSDGHMLTFQVPEGEDAPWLHAIKEEAMVRMQHHLQVAKQVCSFITVGNLRVAGDETGGGSSGY